MRMVSANNRQVRSESADHAEVDEFPDRLTLSQRGRVTLARLDGPARDVFCVSFKSPASAVALEAS
jgi:hypothetical protein